MYKKYLWIFIEFFKVKNVNNGEINLKKKHQNPNYFRTEYFYNY